LMAAHELRNLARLCGVTMEYRDNFGKRRRPSRAAMEALLTAMGVPCGTPAEIRDSLEHSLSLQIDRLLPPVTVATPDPGRRLLLNLRWPRPEIPSGVEMNGEFTGEHGGKREWLPSASQLTLKAVQPANEGYILQLSLPLPHDLTLGYYDLKFNLKIAGREISADTYLAVSPGQAYVPPDLEHGERLWGLNLPLYALRSSHNWGIGDFEDLRAATAWAQELGAAFVGINPLHAPQPGIKDNPSPYSPSSRLFLNYLYVNLEKVPDLQDSPEAAALLASPDFQADLDRLREAFLVRYQDVRRLKEKFLHILFNSFSERHGFPEAPRTPRGRDFARFVAEGGKTLENFCIFQALGEHQGKKDWRRWPRDLRRPDTQAVAAFAREHPQEIAFYQYVQWLAAGQRQEVWAEASRVGLPFTLYQDMALGAHADGFETWGHPGFFANGADVGAPPDAFNLKGQNWGLPPVIPRSLEESGYRLFIDIMRANLPPGGIIRLDHVMGLFRLYWIPAGLDPMHGAYVRYPARELLGLLSLESQRRRTLVIGEDLGTVAPSIRRQLAQSRIFSYRVFYFERKGKNDKTFSPPEVYPRQAMACITTHDLPTLAGYWEGRDLDLKKEFNLYPSPRMAEEDAASRAEDRRLLVEALVRQGLLPPDYSPPADVCPEEIRRGVLTYLGQSRAALVETRLEDFLGLTAQQNLPGTTDQHPNWAQKIFATLEELRHNPEISRLAATLRQTRKEKT
jgi:4-alpha-glucanotransferase